MNENQENKISMAAKWLQMLIIICVVSMVSSLANIFPFVPPSLTTWTNRAIMAAMTVCTYKLAPWNTRYKKAAIFRALMLVCTLTTAFLFQSTVLTFAASICSFISVYQEYCAHAELIEEKDPKLSGCWHSLFLWSIIAGVLVSFGATVMVLLMIVAMQEGNTANITTSVLVILSVPQIVVNIIYIRYLRKMVVYLMTDCEASIHDL